MQGIKLLFVIGTLGDGGAERVVANLANRFAVAGMDVSVMTVYGGRKDYPIEDGVKIYNSNPNCRHFRRTKRIKNIRNMMKAIKPDCIISFLADVNIQVILARFGIKIPLIVSERNDPNNDPPQVIVRKLRDILYRLPDGFVFQTKDAEQYFRKTMKKNSVSRIIGNPITPNLPLHRSDSSCRRVITACRLNNQKNLPVLIDAIIDVNSRDCTCTLDIYGDGPLKNDLQAYIDSHNAGEYVRLMGYSKDIYCEMANSAVFALSSDFEGISNSMLEAMAIGVPVVVTDCPVGGARTYIKNGENGFLVGVGDSKAMADTLCHIFRHREDAESVAKNAEKIREILNIEAISEEWLSILKELLQYVG